MGFIPTGGGDIDLFAFATIVGFGIAPDPYHTTPFTATVVLTMADVQVYVQLWCGETHQPLSHMVVTACTRHSLWISLPANSTVLVRSPNSHKLASFGRSTYLCPRDSIAFSLLHSIPESEDFLLHHASKHFSFTYKTLIFNFFSSQILFQVMIILTGNFNFFNVLTIVMCIPLLDDSILGKRTTSSKDNQSNSWEYLFNGLLIGLLSFYTIQYFDVSFEGQSLSTGPNTKVNFTYDQFNRFLIHAVIASFWLGLISFAIVAYYAFKR